MKPVRIIQTALFAMALLASAKISQASVLDPAFKPLVEQFNAMANGSLWGKALWCVTGFGRK
jgi:hypothetical protein